MISTAARQGTSGPLHVTRSNTMLKQHKGVTYVARTLCYELGRFYIDCDYVLTVLMAHCDTLISCALEIVLLTYLLTADVFYRR